MEKILKATIEITIPADYENKTTEEIIAGMEQAIEEHTKLRVWVTETE